MELWDIITLYWIEYIAVRVDWEFTWLLDIETDPEFNDPDISKTPNWVIDMELHNQRLQDKQDYLSNLRIDFNL
jgi:hypothetical protein